MSRPKRLGGAATRVVPTGGGGAKDFRKVAGGDVAYGCNLPLNATGALAGPGCGERRGRYRPEITSVNGQIFARDTW